MAKPSYFKHFPNIKYAVSANKAGQANYIDIKDYFHLLRVRDDIFTNDTLYYDYVIRDGQRPDQVSYDEYGDEQYYWLILQVNDIVDYYNEWPLSNYEFERFILRKYKSYEKAGETKFYRSLPTYDSENNLVYPGGVVVDEFFGYSYPDYPGSSVFRNVINKKSVSNMDYERELNEEKMHIRLIQKKYLGDIMRELRRYAVNLTIKGSDINITDILT